MPSIDVIESQLNDKGAPMLLDIEGTPTEVIPVGDFKFPGESEIGGHFHLTCRNHPTAKYLTKNPYTRNLHFIEGPKEHPFNECICEFSDLVVVPKKDN